MFVSMADPSQPSGVGGNYEGNRKVSCLIYSTGTERKKFPLLSRYIFPGPGIAPKPPYTV